MAARKPKPTKRLERDEENDIVKLAKRAGGVALKLKLDGERGFPDRTLLFPRAFVIFIEVKRHAPGSKESAQQKRWLAKLRALGFTAEVCRTAAEVEALLPWV